MFSKRLLHGGGVSIIISETMAHKYANGDTKKRVKLAVNSQTQDADQLYPAVCRCKDCIVLCTPWNI